MVVPSPVSPVEPVLVSGSVELVLVSGSTVVVEVDGSTVSSVVSGAVDVEDEVHGAV
jgi:hypothetical protein